MPETPSTPLSLARFEVKRFRGPLPRLALVFILLIPLLYGCIYLAGNWDPYGRLNHVPVAVVNLDQPTTYNDKEVHAGQDFVDSLHRAGTFDFIDTDAQEAAHGLERGRYYLTITVPEDFSAHLVSAAGDDPQRAQIKLRRNDANGFVIGTITNSAQNSIARAIDETAVQSYFEAVFANLATIRGSISEAAAGATQLDEGLAAAYAGSTTLRDGAATAASGAQTLDTGAAQLATAAKQAADGSATLLSGLRDLDSGAGSLASGSAQVANGTQQLTDTVDPVLTLAAERLPEIQATATKLADSATELTATLASGAGNISATAQAFDGDLDALLAANPSLANDPAFKRLKSGADKIATQTGTVAQRADEIADGVAAIDTDLKGVGDLSTKATDAKAKVDALNAGAHDVASGAEQLHHGAGQALTGATTLNSGLGQLSDGAAQLSTGATTLADGLGELSTGAASLDDGLGKLAPGAHELATALTTGAKRIPALTEDQQADAVHVLSAPVDVPMEVDNPAHVYGRGLAPMFFSIALWVLGISAFFLIRPITGRVLAARGNDLRIGLTAWLTLGGVSVVAGWLMLGAAWIGLGLDPAHPWLMVLLVTLVALAFSAVAHLMRTWLGLVATAAMLVLLIIQLTAAGGTYPPELLPPFFQALGPFMPMTYTIDAFRIAISGGLMSRFVRDVVLLVVLFASCIGLLMLVVHRRRRFRMNDLHPPLG